MWTTFLLPTLLLAALAATAKSLTLKPDCQSSCGVVDIPYPFGIGPGCFRPGFEIICNKSTPIILGKTSQASIEVLGLAVTPRPEVQVMLPVAYQCYNSANDIIGKNMGDVDFNSNGVYRISNTQNELFVLGCNTFVYTNSGPTSRYKYTYYTGCVAYANNDQSAQDGACAGVGCCNVDIPPGLTDNRMRFANDGSWSHADQEFCPCDYAFIVEKGNYTFRVANLHIDMSLVDWRLPLRLDWAIRERIGGRFLSCAEAAGMPGYTCTSDHSECVDSSNGPGYVCNCTQGYEGNPYLHNGCTNINECSRPWEFPCYGVCHDTEASYDCRCHPGYQSTGDPKESPCNPKFSRHARIALGISLGVFFLVVALLLTFIIHQKRKLAHHFEMNGGNILKKVIGLTIFTEKDLNKITKNNSERLGNGYFGRVYKGTLPDETVVAVKSFIKVDAERIEEFTEEVMIQLKMNHPNVLKLMGCCLQLDVPMLVYEFAANGSLKDILRINKRKKLSVDLRLGMAIGSAEGLGYMHSEGIRHGDVKPDNMLLNEKFIPKISDFGLSKLLKLGERIANKVVGCEGYMDPVFRNTGLLTPKSDVYSFGVVLLELISGKQIAYGQSGSLVIEFRHVYETEKSGRSMFDMDIVTEEDIFILEEIGKLAMKCLKEHQDGRPDMTEVAKQLLKLRKNTVDDAATTLR